MLMFLGFAVSIANRKFNKHALYQILLIFFLLTKFLFRTYIILVLFNVVEVVESKVEAF